MDDHTKLRLSQLFHERGNIIVSVAVRQSGVKQMSIFFFKIL